MLLIIRITFCLIWLGIPIGLIVGIGDEYLVTLFIFCAYMLFTHTMLAIMFRQLWQPYQWRRVMPVLLFGSVEINRLRRQSKKS